MTVRVVTDSTSDLPSDLCRDLGITVVPLRVYFGEEAYQDGVDLSAEEFYQKLTRYPQLPKTSQPSAGVFAETYSALAKETDEILSIHISSGLSQTYNTALLAAKEVEGRCKVEVVDSLQASLGLGLVVIITARAARDGVGLDEVMEIANRAAAETRTICLLDTLEYMAKGGRIGKLKFYLGSSLRPLSVFKVIPMLVIKDGEAHPFDRVRTRQKGLDRLVREALEADGMTDFGVAHSTTPSEAEELYQRIGERVPRDHLYISRFGPVLGTYIGPRGIGVTMTRV
ncbi:MAG: DegV family protein [Dehalococcoidia bacterium]